MQNCHNNEVVIRYMAVLSFYRKNDIQEMYVVRKSLSLIMLDYILNFTIQYET